MNLFELFATISLDTSEYEKNLDKAGKGFSDFGGKLKSGLATAAKIGASFTTAITAGAGGAIAALNGIAESTEESRIATGKLNTAFEAAGMSSEAAATAYSEFYKILGDTDTATEASQLLAQLAENEQDLTEWTRIAAGVNGTFGDSLPIEALIESANETAKVGQVTGNLADALNWVGISEDEFNAKLAAASSESERNQLIMKTLSGTYEKASESFYKNNDAIVKQRESQIKLDEAMSKVGTSVANVKNNITSGFMPAIVEMADGLAKIIGNDSTGLTALNGGITEFVNKLSEMVTPLFEVGANIVMTLVDGVVNNIPQLVSTASDIILKLTGYITELLPNLASAAIEIVTTLGGKIAEAAPQLITGVTTAITKLVEMLTNPDALVQMVDVALKLVLGLADGIIKAIPQLLKSIPTVINNIVTAVVDSIPLIIDAGINLMTSLLDNVDLIVSGLMDGTFAIIDGIINFLVGENGQESGLTKIINAGVKLMGALFEKMPDILFTLGRNVKLIVDKLIEKFKETDWAQVGKDLINSVWTGIQNAWSTLVEDVKNLWNEFTSWLDGEEKSTTHASSSGRTHGGGYIDGSHFGGLDYVPYDGYIAELHKGEMVLTANEAQPYRSNERNNVSITENIYVQGDYDAAEMYKHEMQLAARLVAM